MTPLLAVLFLLQPVSSAVTGDSTPAHPLLAVFEEPAFDIGVIETSQTPLFVLYDDGTIIYCTRRTDTDVRFATARLRPSELKALLDSLDLDRTFFPLDSTYNNAPNISDMPIYIIWGWRGAIAKRVTLIGALDSTSFEAGLGHRDSRATNSTEFVRLFLRLCAYRSAKAKVWHPGGFEVVLSDFSYARKPPFAWPSDWPTLENPGVRKDGRGSYHVPLTEGRFRSVRRFGRAAHERPFALGGANWFGAVRVVFPAEEQWLRN